MTKKLFVLVILLLVSAPVFAQSVDTAWVRRYNGPGNVNDYAYRIAVDISGYVYVIGESEGDYATIKYYPNGDTVWLRRYNGPGNMGDEAYRIALDDSGNVYVTGYSKGGDAGTNYTTVKYSSNGDIVWVRDYNGPGLAGDCALGIAVDSSGNVYVTGKSTGIGTYEDYATIKYYPNGDTAWVRRYNGPGNYHDNAYSIALDESGNVYVTGYSVGSGTSDDFATIKYFSNGDTAWIRRYNGPGNGRDAASAIVVDTSGSVYVSGYSYGSETFEDYATIKYSPNGDTAWVRRYNGERDSSDGTEAIAVDDSGNVYVTGHSFGIGTSEDYVTIKYYSSGDTAWVRRYNGEGNGDDRAYSIAVDSSGNVYVSGYSYGSGTDLDYASVKYYPNGDVAWEIRYNNAGSSHDNATSLALDNSGNVYVTGNSRGSGTEFDYATIKYVQFLCGDVNKDGVVNSADIIYLINYLFIGGPSPIPILHVGDVNVDEAVNSADVSYLINYLFIGGPAPCG